MFNSLSIHEVKKVTAHTYEDLDSTPITLQMVGKDGERTEITLHTYDAAFSLSLVAAINKVDEDRQPKAVDPDPEPPQPIDDGSCDPLRGQRMDSTDLGEIEF